MPQNQVSDTIMYVTLNAIYGVQGLHYAKHSWHRWSCSKMKTFVLTFDDLPFCEPYTGPL